MNGVIYGSMAAPMFEGLPRLPRDADIAMNWSLDEFLEWFRVFGKEDWYHVELYRLSKRFQRRTGIKYVLTLKMDVGLSVGIIGKSKPCRIKRDSVCLDFDKDVYVREKILKLRDGFGTILDLLDLYYLGFDAESLISLLSEGEKSKIIEEASEYRGFIPKENHWFLDKLVDLFR